jgi:hypothetical protein
VLYQSVVHHLIQSRISALDQLHEIKANFFPALQFIEHFSEDGRRFVLDERQHRMAQCIGAAV